MTPTMHTLTLASSGWLHDLIFRTEPGALHGSDSDDLFLLIFWIAVFFFVLLMFLMCFWAIKYRRKPGTIAPASASHNTPLEVAWTVIPLGILGVMFFKGFNGYMASAVAPAGGIDLELRAFQWDWEITYPTGEQSPEKVKVGDKDAPIFVVPAGVPVKLRMHSSDVIHSFWVPDFRCKFDVMPNRYTTYWFQAEEPRTQIGGRPNPLAGTGKLKDGTEYVYEDHWLFCAEFCGDSHSEMTAMIRVVPEKIYPRIIDTWGTAGMSPAQLGKRVWTVKCATCHTTDGKGGTGPTWVDVYGAEVEFSDGTKYTADQMRDEAFFANYIRESILEPQKKIVKNFGPLMTSFQGLIKEEEIAGVIAFMKTISKYAPQPAPAAGGDKKADEPKAVAPVAPAGK